MDAPTCPGCDKPLTRVLDIPYGFWEWSGEAYKLRSTSDRVDVAEFLLHRHAASHVRESKRCAPVSSVDRTHQREQRVVLADRQQLAVAEGPAARREIYLALADDPGVETDSDGEGFLKRIVIRPRRRR